MIKNVVLEKKYSDLISDLLYHPIGIKYNFTR